MSRYLSELQKSILGVVSDVPISREKLVENIGYKGGGEGLRSALIRMLDRGLIDVVFGLPGYRSYIETAKGRALLESMR